MKIEYIQIKRICTHSFKIPNNTRVTEQNILHRGDKFTIDFRETDIESFKISTVKTSKNGDDKKYPKDPCRYENVTIF